MNERMIPIGLAVFLAAAGASSSSSSSYAGTNTYNVGCHQLSMAYPNLVFYPNTINYKSENTNFWSAAAVLSPYCVFTPECAEDVAGGLAVLTATKTPFGVQSGGHMPVTGAASTDHGVLIGMTNLNKIELKPTPNEFNQAYVSFGPGLRWGYIYDWLNPYGLIVAGGRVSTVGSSLLLGGGISYFSGNVGWAANTVVNYELVTADSKILQVNARSHPDLFWALKGGSNNFGIVTRYDLKTYPKGPIFGGTVSWDTQYVQRYIDAHSAFIAPGGGADDPKAAIMPDWQITPLTGDLTAASVLLYDAADPAPRALENFTSIPTTSSSVAVQKFSLIAQGTSGFGNRDLRESFYNTALKASAESMAIINDTLITLAKSKLSKVNCTVGAAVQPITQDFLQSARDAGGDAIDLDPADGRFVVALIYARWPYAADDAAIYDFQDIMIRTIAQRSMNAGLYYNFTFLNDAGHGQNPFILYGKGKSLPRMKKISQAYDPEGVFQKLESGFKLNDPAILI